MAELATGIKSLRIFFSYSHENRVIIGNLKKHLELIGFEVFIAHEDIEAGIKWQEEIIKNLKKCDIFIPLFSKEFKESNWTNQELGFAFALEKIIIPIQLDIAPYGFIGHIQSLKIKTGTEDEVEKIFAIIKDKSNFELDDLRSFIINSFIDSGDFASAKCRARLLVDFNDFTSDEIQKLFIATKDNRQINGCFVAQSILLKIFGKYKKYLTESQFKEVKSLLIK